MTNPLAVDEIRGCPNKHGRGASSCCGLRFAAERVNTNVVRTFQSGVFMPSIFVSPYVLPIMLLFASNLFMTIAWYGHLRFKEVPLFGVIVVSWLIAFVEYCAAVPANRWGSAVYTTRAAQDNSGGDHTSHLRRLLDRLPQGTFDLELRDRVRADCLGRVLRFSRPAMMQCEAGCAFMFGANASTAAMAPFQFFMSWS
jgi:hypothetical protein